MKIVEIIIKIVLIVIVLFLYVNNMFNSYWDK